MMRITWQGFLVGVVCGAVLMVVAGEVWLRWGAILRQSDDWHPSMGSAEDKMKYDQCLVAQAGNKVVCDSYMRLLSRYKAAEMAMQEQAATMLAAGVSKCDVVKWGYKMGFVGSQMSEAVDIPLQDLSKC
jgi:hypothetical protein